ncbi:MAG TPA: hypothetical protein VGS07_10580 [Thermoanaerobaculia bacterium]|jgi:hypothetical protein|nr:hypothetical protein [Thermoanaerobaculia bacterium]
MDVGEFLAVPANREAVRAVALKALTKLEPSGAEVALGYLEPLIDMAARGEVVTMDLWDEAGRFGTVDLLVPLVAPLVAQALARAGGGIASVTVEDVKRMVLRVRSPQGRRRLREIEGELNAAFVEHGNGEGPGEGLHAD